MGGPLSLPYQTQVTEAHAIITAGILHKGLRLPVVIEGVRLVFNNIESNGFPEIKDPNERSRVKKEKIERLSVIML